MWQRLSPREKRFAVLTLIVVLSALVYRIVLLPELRRLWALQDSQANLELQVLEMERALALGDRIEERYKRYEAIIEQKATDLEESTDFLRTLSDATKAYDMKVVGQWTPPILASEYYKIFSGGLRVDTRPVWLARFLASLEKGNQLIRVEDISIRALDDAENLRVEMKLTKVVAAEKSSKL
jgi:type II secretory pathway component PulM